MNELCICIRCHDYPEAVLDTIRTVKKYSTTDPCVMVAIDNQDPNNIAPAVDQTYEDVGVYISDHLCGWGRHLYSLFVEALRFAQDNFRFRHFICMDYDTVYTREGADQLTLDTVATDNTVLVGALRKPHRGHMAKIRSQWEELNEVMNLNPLTLGYLEYLNSYVLGAYMMLTDVGIERFEREGYFEEPFLSEIGYDIPDDSWISLLSRNIGGVEGIGSYNEECDMQYTEDKVTAITWKVPVPVLEVVNKGMYVYHPVKGTSGGKKKMSNKEFKTEMSIRHKLRQELDKRDLNE